MYSMQDIVFQCVRLYTLIWNLILTPTQLLNSELQEKNIIEINKKEETSLFIKYTFNLLFIENVGYY